MHIQSAKIENIRNIESFEMTFSEGEALAGWHVLIGDNGSGKSTVLKALALGLMDIGNLGALRQDWNTWIRDGQDSSKIELVLDRDSYRGQATLFYSPTLSVKITRFDGIAKVEGGNYEFLGNGSGRFSAAFGPFRRLSGGSTEYEKLIRSNPRLSAHLSIFGEDIALTEAISWLVNLNYRRLEGHPAGELLVPLQNFINQSGFLPNDVKLSKISSDGVTFTDSEGITVSVESLSDGYRSILSMTFEIIRQMTLAYSLDAIFPTDDHTVIELPGVVLIDEVDAHLHPEWQRRIGTWFTEHFPNVQFIVTTHSPLVCQAAVKGSIWRLPAPGSGKVGYRVDKDNPETAEEWKRLVYGNILEAYSTDLFGEHIDRSEVAQAKYQALARLSRIELKRPLTENERQQLQSLLDELPNTPDKHLATEP
ncbi:MAG: AAA family ATPase [Phototrophicaceae bacterium]